MAVTDPKDDLQELATGIARIISDNKKFLARLMDDEYEPEEELPVEDEEDDETPVG
jgi:hypothetical protein